MEAAGSAQGAPALNVCVDRRSIGWSKGTGASTYADGLRQGVLDAGFPLAALTDSPGTEIVAPGRAWRWAAALAPWPIPAIPHPDGLLATDVFRRAQVHFDVYGRYLRLRPAVPPGLMHWSYPLPIHLAGVPNLYSVLDLIPLLRPDLTAIRQTRSRRMLDRLRTNAAYLVTISETSRQEIIATLGWPPDRVVNTYLPVDPPEWTRQRAAAGISAVTEALGLEQGQYFLHVGTVERRKNIARLIDAYRRSGSRRPLVLAGPDGWCAAEELSGAADLLVTAGEAARQAAGRPRVLRVDWMARDMLLALLQGATALLAPSLAEGFGLPAVEAMALGTPVLTSDTGASAEVADSAALLVDPGDVRALGIAIAALDGDPGLRAHLSAAGRVRARAFSASAYASRLAALYSTVLDRHRTDQGGFFAG